MPFSVEWKGKEFTVFVALEVLEDLGHFRERQSEAAYVETFQEHRGVILDGARRAIENPDNHDRQGRVHVRGNDIPELIG